MKIKCLFLVALLLAFSSIGFAQSKTKAGYIGEWYEEHADEMVISATKIQLIHATSSIDMYRDITGKGNKAIYYLQIIRNRDEKSTSSDYNFRSVSIDEYSGSESASGKGKKPKQITILKYKTLADMKAGRNPEHGGEWTRSGETISDTPEMFIKRLYLAQKIPRIAPFFQAKNRYAVNWYFDALADVIWKDAAKGKAGAINFDPLYSSQNPQTADFTISRNEKLDDAGNTWVNVKFKNAGRDEEVNYELHRSKSKAWKIVNIHYSDREDLAALLRLSQDAEFRDDHDHMNAPNIIFNGEFLVGAVKCAFTPLGQLKYRFKCADRNDYQVYLIEEDYSVSSIEANGEEVKRGQFVLSEHDNDNFLFIDSSGKEVKFSRIKVTIPHGVLGPWSFHKKNHTSMGELQIGATESLILQFNQQANAYAAYCFANKSAAGRAILAKCKNRRQCEFTGTIESDSENRCKVPKYLKQSSIDSRIVEISSVRFVAANPTATKKRNN